MIEPSLLKDEYTIRQASAADIEAACDIAKLAWQPIHDSFTAIMGKEMHDDLNPRWKERKAEQIRAHFAERPAWVLVVEDEENGIVSFITFRLDADRSLGTIGLNAVAPGAQGAGIGTAMYGVVFDLFRRGGLKYASVHTGLDEGHVPARRAYERAGFDVRREDVTYFKKL